MDVVSDRSILVENKINRMAEVRLTTLNWMIKAMLAVGAPCIILNIATEFHYHIHAEVPMKEMALLSSLYVFLYVLAIFIATLKKMGYTVRACGFLSLFFMLALMQLWLFGISSSGDMIMLLFVIFTGMLFDIRAGLKALLLCLLATFVLGYSYSVGFISIVRQQQMLSDDMGDWINIMLLLAFLGASALAMAAFIQKGLATSVENSLKLVDELRHEVDMRKKTERQSQELAKKYRLLAENAADVISTWDLSLRCTYISPSIKRVQGYTPDELIGQPIAEFMTPASFSHASQLLAGELAKEEQSDADPFRNIIAEMELLRKDGTTMWTEVKASFLRDGNGHPVSILFVTRDITDRKQAEEEAEHLAAQLHQAQKMEAVGQLAGGIAHDFNNLLQVILGYGDMVLGDINAGNPVSKAMFDEILRAGERARVLIRQLLAFSRCQALEMSAVNLNGIINELMKMLHRILGEHISLEFLDDRHLGAIYADPVQIEQILINLCINARDAMPHGGQIIIETKSVQIDLAFCERYHWVRPGFHALLSVTDTGCGMNEATIARIFEPFFTTKEKEHGTGLGLATVYGLVKQHGGVILVDSTVGKGTAFTLYFPLTESTALTVEVPPEDPVPMGTETILLAEDDEMVRQLAKTFLEEAGYTVLVACDGEEACRIFQEQAHQVALVVLDVIMPKLNGFKVYEHIRKSSAVPVQFTSGYSLGIIDGISNNNRPLLQKPYHRNALLRKVREVLDNPTGS